MEAWWINFTDQMILTVYSVYHKIFLHSFTTFKHSRYVATEGAPKWACPWQTMCVRRCNPYLHVGRICEKKWPLWVLNLLLPFHSVWYFGVLEHHNAVWLSIYIYRCMRTNIYIGVRVVSGVPCPFWMSLDVETAALISLLIQSVLYGALLSIFGFTFSSRHLLILRCLYFHLCSIMLLYLGTKSQKQQCSGG